MEIKTDHVLVQYMYIWGSSRTYCRCKMRILIVGGSENCLLWTFCLSIDQLLIELFRFSGKFCMEKYIAMSNNICFNLGAVQF